LFLGDCPRQEAPSIRLSRSYPINAVAFVLGARPPAEAAIIAMDNILPATFRFHLLQVFKFSRRRASLKAAFIVKLMLVLFDRAWRDDSIGCRIILWSIFIFLNPMVKIRAAFWPPF